MGDLPPLPPIERSIQVLMMLMNVKSMMDFEFGWLYRRGTFTLLKRSKKVSNLEGA